MAEECPNCGAPFSESVTVELGDRYESVFGVPPSSLFSEFARVCPDPETARRASGDPNVGIEVFLHRFADFEPGVTAD